MRWLPAAVFCFALVSVAAVLAPRAGHYRDGPPTGHTGGFGEPTCVTCHFGSPLNDDSGHLAINGLPATFQRDSTYSLELLLSGPELGAAGFQLAVRDTAGTQLGTLRSTDPLTIVTAAPDGVQFIHHSQHGATPVTPHQAKWSFAWTAPSSATGPAVLSFVANAANGDNSELGDLVFQVTTTVPASIAP